MVRLGFIVEGDSEKIVLEKSDFFQFLDQNAIDYVPSVINAEGNGNLLPYRIHEFTQILIDKGANQIIVLTDLDTDACKTITKNRIQPLSIHSVVICVKELEAWYLADTAVLNNYTRNLDYKCADPEVVNKPFEEVKRIRMESIGRGVGTKPSLANQMVRYGFSIQNAARHPNCKSAQYFLNKISSLVAIDSE